jgi:hypothetical protein
VNLKHSIAESPLTTILLGDGQNNWQTLDDYVSSGRASMFAGRSDAPKLLKISGPLLGASSLSHQWPDEIDIGTEDDRPRQRYVVTIGGMRALSVLYMDQKVESADQLRNVIAMGVQSDRDDCCISALLLKAHNGIYTRIGMMKLSCESSCRSNLGYHAFWRQGTRVRTIIVG